MRKSQYYDKDTHTIMNPLLFVDNVSRDKMDLVTPIRYISKDKIAIYQEEMNHLPKFN